MFKRPQYILFAIVLVLTVVLLKLPSRTTAQLKLAIGGFFLPLFGLASSGEKAVERAGDAIVPKERLLDQLGQLQRENQELRIRAMQAEEALKENARLRQHFNWQRQLPWKLLPARVVSRDPANWWRTVRIDRGLRDGIATNAPVLTAQGLVGRVSEVSFAQSQVVLLGDPDCRVSVLVEDEKNREHAIIAPASSSPLDSTLVELGYLSRHCLLKPGQRVVTSGLGGIFPAGILIGQVVDFRSVDYGLYNEARVRLAVNVNALEEVFVKLP